MKNVSSCGDGDLIPVFFNAFSFSAQCLNARIQYMYFNFII